MTFDEEAGLFELFLTNIFKRAKYNVYTLMTFTISDIIKKKLETIEEMTSVQEGSKENER